MIPEPQYRLEAAEFQYPQASTPTLRGLNIEIRVGERVALLGSNGSGKSTLLKLLSALLTPTQGLCFVCGKETSSLDPAELRGISAMVFQNPEDQIVASTVEEETAFGPENMGLPSAEIIKRVDEALTAAGLSDKKKKLVAQLSGGQKQRLALAGALAMHPKAILLDEALSMLDARSRLDFSEIIKKEHQKGTTIVEVTHRLEEIRDAERVIILDKGTVAEDMGSREFFMKSSEWFTARRLEKPPFEKLRELLAAEKLASGNEKNIGELAEKLCR